MKIIAKSFFLLLVTALFWAMPANTWGDVTIDGIKYYLDSSKMTASVTGYSGFPTDVTIPDVINDGDKDYTVTEIGRDAFYECTSLISIEIPASVTYIGDYAFYYCIGLTSIKIPESVTEIGEGVFSGCTSLTSVDVDENNKNYSIEDGVLYDKDKTMLIYCPVGYIGAFEVPSSVITIGCEAFNNCTNLTSVTFAEGSKLENIGEWTFATCTSLTSIEIPASVTKIGEGVFSACTSLTSIEIPASVTEIGYMAFYYCISLTSVTYAEGSKLENIGDYAFYYCENLTSIEIPAGVTAIGEGVFSGCTSLTSIEIPANVTQIGYEAFYDCTGLTSIIFAKESKLENIRDYAFYYCTSLTSIEIPAGVNQIGDYAFYWCTSLASIKIPASVTEIGEEVFSGCTSLTSVNVDENNKSYSSEGGVLYDKDKTILIYCPVGYVGAFEVPSSVTSIKNSAFSYCNRLTSVTFGEGSKLENIGSNAFYYCVSLTSIKIPASVTEIGEGVFPGCTSLTSVNVDENNKNYSSEDGILYDKDKTKLIYCPVGYIGAFEVPSSVTSIVSGAFSFCTSLTSIEIPASVTEIGYETFFNCISLNSVTFAEGSKLEDIEDYAFYCCTSLTSIEIPASVTSIGDYAFYYCTNLTSVTFAEGSKLGNIGDYAFYYCTNLTSVTFAEGSKLGNIGDYAFCYCTNLNSVTFADGSKLEYIGSGAFYFCTSLASIEIPVGVTSLGYMTFYSCASLKEVTFLGNQPEESLFVFGGCDELECIYFMKGKEGWEDGGTWNGKLTIGLDPEKPEISFNFVEGKLVLTFTGALEGSEDGKQWTAINAVSPYTVEMTGGKKFFRAVGVQVGNELGGEGGAEVGKSFIIPLSDTVELEMIWVEPGTFKMGSPEDELGRWGEETQHQVTLTKGYWLGKYEVTQGQYEVVMEGNPSCFKGENLPVERVTWYNAMDFCAKLTEIERAAGRLPEGYEYTLPTEAQWEYACRAGTTTALNSGKSLTSSRQCPNLDEVGWYYYNSDRQTHPVGEKQPNAWGFYDMHGNVYEWCLDWRGDYPTGSVTDPTGPATGSDRVIRGGSWSYDADCCRSAFRSNRGPSYNGSNDGFRVALSMVQ